MNPRPQLQIHTPDASSEETAAIAAAIEQLLRDTTPVIEERDEPDLSAWKRKALTEGIAPFPE